MTAPRQVIDLVERFNRNRESYLSTQYNETQLRREFLDPFFEALGWDVHNKRGHAEPYKDVVHEDAIKVGGFTKAPDYCFRTGGTRKLFVEAKKPAVSLKDDITPAFQLRRYAWSAKLPLSILTDFEEFAVYDCRVRPSIHDKPTTARILYLNSSDYVQRWDEIAAIFSRDAVLQGLFDKHAESTKVKKGTAEVDEAFLGEIEAWRGTLARMIAIRNPRVTTRELNFAVQRTIDRIIFLRICEDRGIEDYGRLMSLLNGRNVYKRLTELFRGADERYNSGLFHFRQERGRAEAPDYQGPGGNWRLTTAERKRILLNGIYGTDVDSQAVEVTKLSLLLKVLEGESAQTLTTQLRFFHERALPDLGNNIKCGNSLIASDFYHNQQMSLLDDEELLRVNAFDWKTEFQHVFRGGGFDIVVGNPPWGAELRDRERTYLKHRHPEVADFESSQYFLMRSLALLENDGLLGMILPNTFALNVHAKRCRDALLDSGSIASILDLSEVDVFLGPHVRSLVTIAQRNGRTRCDVFKFDRSIRGIRLIRKTKQRDLKQAETWKGFLVEDTPLTRLVDRLVRENPPLAVYCDVRQGYIPYRTTTLTRRFGRPKAEEIVSQRLWHSKQRLGPEYQRELQGADVGRYTVDWSGAWVRYGEWVSTYLPLSMFSGERVLVREITGELPHALFAAYTSETYVHNPSVLAVLPKPGSVSPKFVVGILNSRLMSLIFSQVAPKAKKGLFPKIIITDAKRLPFPKFDLKDASQRAQHDRLVGLVETMSENQHRLKSAKIPQERTATKRQIAALDDQIDRTVYGLYQLDEDEVQFAERTSESEN